MTKSNILPFTQNIVNAGVQILPADTTTLKTLYTASTNDAIVKSLIVNSTDTAAQTVNLWLNISGVDTLLGTVTIPLASGTNGTVAAVDLLSGAIITGLPLDASGKRVLPLKAGTIVKISTVGTVTAAKAITAVALVEEY